MNQANQSKPYLKSSASGASTMRFPCFEVSGDGRQCRTVDLADKDSYQHPNKHLPKLLAMCSGHGRRIPQVTVVRGQKLFASSRPSHRVMFAESYTEHLHLLELEADLAGVLYFDTQPLSILVSDRRYTPDMLVVKEHSVVLQEIKEASFKQTRQWLDQFERQRNHFRDLGFDDLELKLIDCSSIRYKKLSALHRWAKEFCPEFLETIPQGYAGTVNDLWGEFNREPNALGKIYASVFFGFLKYESTERCCLDTVVTFA
ncbi:MAG: hypothetical protein HWE12_07450 [Oceanospirillaceae bacterium]|nr:hypothetical protein [Oceanospirillaceae bacterium]